MMKRQYKIGRSVLELNLPEPIQLQPQYSLFAVENAVPNYTVQVEFQDKIEEDASEILFSVREYTMHRQAERYRFFYPDTDKGCVMAMREISLASPCAKLVLASAYQGTLSEKFLFSLLGIEHVLLAENMLIMHASIVQRGEKALLFTGPCGIGKSTQASLWAEHRQAKIINGDKAVLCMRHGVPYACGLPFSGSSPYCENAELPIERIVLLTQGKVNHLEKQEGMAAFLALYRSIYPVAFSKAQMEKQMQLAEQLAAKTEIYTYACLPDASAVEFLERSLFPHA